MTRARALITLFQYVLMGIVIVGAIFGVFIAGCISITIVGNDYGVGWGALLAGVEVGAVIGAVAWADDMSKGK